MTTGTSGQWAWRTVLCKQPLQVCIQHSALRVQFLAHLLEAIKRRVQLGQFVAPQTVQFAPVWPALIAAQNGFHRLKNLLVVLGEILVDGEAGAGALVVHGQ